ncbi:DNA polymerase III subunit chi [Roseibium sp. CAU 1637]|uniref:DNA polymerase III subunit chi n=1 Tax=Roseibium limicola TaxID=2816037 RepID=A0A939EPF7_9HYPH|nr:DNA polymerase III subunit chi [Roseibium limicola]MBO0346182.1 DNA polymerase III subunit chi [Roseibium limicola]
MSTDVLFYHLMHQPLEAALPKLLLKCLERDWTVTVQTGTSERRDALNAHLWTFSDDSFLPHGTLEDDFPELQPIYLTHEVDNPNEANVRFLVDKATPPELAAYERVVFLFDGNDQQALGQARQQWKVNKDAGHALTYWQQTDTGGWERKA